MGGGGVPPPPPPPLPLPPGPQLGHMLQQHLHQHQPQPPPPPPPFPPAPQQQHQQHNQQQQVQHHHQVHQVQQHHQVQQQQAPFPPDISNGVVLQGPGGEPGYVPYPGPPPQPPTIAPAGSGTVAVTNDPSAVAVIFQGHTPPPPPPLQAPQAPPPPPPPPPKASGGLIPSVGHLAMGIPDAAPSGNGLTISVNLGGTPTVTLGSAPPPPPPTLLPLPPPPPPPLPPTFSAGSSDAGNGSWNGSGDGGNGSGNGTSWNGAMVLESLEGGEMPMELDEAPPPLPPPPPAPMLQLPPPPPPRPPLSPWEMDLAKVAGTWRGSDAIKDEKERCRQWCQMAKASLEPSRERERDGKEGHVSTSISNSISAAVSWSSHRVRTVSFLLLPFFLRVLGWACGVTACVCRMHWFRVSPFPSLFRVLPGWKSFFRLMDEGVEFCLLRIFGRLPCAR